MAYTRIQHRRGTTTQWNQYDPVLGPGEIGVDLTTQRLKMGNGSLKWSELDYFDGTAYDTAVKNGFAGTEEEWLLELVGPPAEITIGTVTTLAPGSDASASISGTAPAYTLNLDIPRGNPGTDIHFAGSVPTVADLPTGAASNDAYIVDEDGNLWVSDGNENWTDAGQIVGPQGPQGIQGEVGNPIVILGSYSSYSNLVSGVADPANGDAYFLTDTLDVWVWFNSQWNNYGSIFNLPNAQPETSGTVYGFTDSGISNTVALGYSSRLLQNSVMIGSYIGRYSNQSQMYNTNNVIVGNNAAESGTITQSVILGSYTKNGGGFSTTEHVVIGANAGQYNDGNRQIAIGYNANPWGSDASTDNLYIGNTSGNQNASNSQSYNIGIGKNVLNSISSNSNIAIGNGALEVAGVASNNTVIGHGAGSALTSGSGNVFIGNNAGASYTATSNILAIDNSSTSTPLVYGNFSTNEFRINGYINSTGNVISGGSISASGSISAAGSISTTSSISASGVITSAGSEVLTKDEKNMIEVSTTSSVSYTISTSSDKGKLKVFTGSNVNIYVPNESTLPVGSTITLLNNDATYSAPMRVNANAGVTIISTPGNRLRTRGSVATLVKIASLQWLLFGDLIA